MEPVPAPSPTPNVKKAEPGLPAITHGGLLAQMTWDRNCKKPGCYGRGFVSETVVLEEFPDGKKITRNTLNPCTCLKYDEAKPYVQIMKRIDEIEAGYNARMEHMMGNQAVMFQFVQKKFNILENLSILIRVLKLWDRVTKKRSPNVKPFTPPVPVPATTPPVEVGAPVETPATH